MGTPFAASNGRRSYNYKSTVPPRNSTVTNGGTTPMKGSEDEYSAENMNYALAIFHQQEYKNDQPMMQWDQVTSMYDLINGGKLGSDYNTIELLNDFHHLLYVHSGEFEEIYRHLSMNAECTNTATCKALLRNNKELSLGMV